MVRAALVLNCWKTIDRATASKVGSRYVTLHAPMRAMTDARMASDFLRWLTAFLMAADPNLTTSGCIHKDAGFNFRRAFVRQWRASVRYFGFSRALQELGAACWRAGLELLP